MADVYSSNGHRPNNLPRGISPPEWSLPLFNLGPVSGIEQDVHPPRRWRVVGKAVWLRRRQTQVGPFRPVGNDQQGADLGGLIDEAAGAVPRHEG